MCWVNIWRVSMDFPRHFENIAAWDWDHLCLPSILVAVISLPSNTSCLFCAFAFSVLSHYLWSRISTSLLSSPPSASFALFEKALACHCMHGMA